MFAKILKKDMPYGWGDCGMYWRQWRRPNHDCLCEYEAGINAER